MNIHIRNYLPSDKENVMAVFDSNCPAYFAPEERVLLENYLDHELEIYAVIESDDRIIGNGGVNTEITEEGRNGIISWGMIHPDFHGMKIGSKLLEWRIEQLKQLPDLQKIIVRTSQLVAPFYAKHGFELKLQKKDFWAKGFDLYQMEIHL